MIKTIFFVFAFCYGSSCFAQTKEQNKVRATIDHFFAGMKAHDSTQVRQTLYVSAFLKSIVKTKTGETKLAEEPIINFLKAIGTPRKESLDERLSGYDIKIDGDMAIAWTPYQFYFDEKFSHCGVNVFTLIKIEENWKIMGIVDTRRKTDCN